MTDNKLEKSVAEARGIQDNRIDDVIGEIFKIESTALGIQSDTEAEKEEYARMMEQKTRAFDEQLKQDTAEKLNSLSIQLKSEKEQQMSAMRNDILNQTSRMEQFYEANHDKWVDEIVESILKE